MKSFITFFLIFLFCLVPLISTKIPVSVMMPLSLIDKNSGKISNAAEITSNLQKLKSGGVTGVMTDVWWGIVQRNGQDTYDWTGYQQFVDIAKNAGLTVQVVMSFHRCGGNVGDACDIPLPSWVLSVANTNNNIFYKDQQNRTDSEYLSLGVDTVPLWNGKTAVDLYAAYMRSFASTFKAELAAGVIDQIQVGLGPAGEMRYPGYQLDRWSYCGVGEFQCNDIYMLRNLSAAAAAVGHPEWGHGGPSNAGGYNSRPSNAAFWQSNGFDNYASDYGKFFLGWYSQLLIDHGDRILGHASQIFAPFSHVNLAAKISGIHWWYTNPSHAAEVTSGYFNTDQNNAYLEIAQMLKKYNADFDFTALEMVDSPNNCGSAPEQLVKQTIQAAFQARIGYAGENALPVCGSGGCNENAFNEIVKESTQYGKINQFTYLRLDAGQDLLGKNWGTFTNFVSRMNSAN